MNDSILLRECSSLEETFAFAKKLACVLQEFSQKLPEKDRIKTFLLFGDLGAGKTTFARAFVSAFKNAEKAEVTSPSFALVNHYPTDPPIVHADLYRLAEMQCQYNELEKKEEKAEKREEEKIKSLLFSLNQRQKSFPKLKYLPEDLEEAFEENQAYILIEWAEFLAPDYLPYERLDIFLEIGHSHHSLLVKGYTALCKEIFQALETGE